MSKSLIKECDDILEDILDIDHHSKLQQFDEIFQMWYEESDVNNNALCKDSEKVTVTVSGYIAKNCLPNVSVKFVFHSW